MNEHRLLRVLRRMLVLCAALPLALFGGGCGGSAVGDQRGEAGAAEGGNGGAGSGDAFVPGAGVGAGAAAGGDSGNGGSAVLGAGGGGNPCLSAPVLGCSGEAVIVVPRTCIAPESSVGTMLPIDTCEKMCNGFLVLGCSLTASDATSATVQCNVACPT